MITRSMNQYETVFILTPVLSDVQMKEAVEKFKGILTAEGKVDIERTSLLVEASQGMDTTFHRAIDMTQDYLQAVEDVISTGCTRILTSGGYDKAAAFYR